MMTFLKLLATLLALGLGSQAFGVPRPKVDVDDDLMALVYEKDTASESSEEEPSEPPPKKGCGWRHVDGIDFKFGGIHRRAKFGEFPWTLAVLEVVAGVDNYVCVATLIHPYIALSVAHYFTKSSNWRVRAGEWNLNGTNEAHPYTVSDVKEVVMHPKFNERYFHNDIALLFLQSVINPHIHIGYACLPAAASVTAPSTDCFVSGWGYRTFNDGIIQAYMKMVKVPVVERNWCEGRIRTEAGFAFNLHSSAICAGGMTGQDACQRDGGAPLVCPYVAGQYRYYQAGIVSWGVSCGLEDMPGVYTNVAALKPWIDETVKLHGYTSETYTV